VKWGCETLKTKCDDISGEVGIRLDFYLLTGIFIQNLNKAENGAACDGSNINYHRAHNRHTPKLPTIQIMNRPKSEPDVKIRYK